MRHFMACKESQHHIKVCAVFVLYSETFLQVYFYIFSFSNYHMSTLQKKRYILIENIQ